MFFTLGLTGFLFACLAPGYIVVTAFKLQPRLPPLAGPFAISLIANNLLVEALVACRFYTQPVMAPLALVTVFIAATLFLFDKRLSHRHLASQVQVAGTALAKFAGSRRICQYSGIACVLGLLTLLAALEVSSEFAKSAILGYDSIASWNQWAVEWAANAFPKYIYHYPQLLPVLLSIPYVITGHSDVEYFSLSFKILFWLLSFETLAFLALRCRNIFLLFSIPLLYFMFHHWVDATSLEDYADVPVAFFSLLSAAVIIASDQGDDVKTIALGLAFASGAAMTKQVGLYMLAATPALVVASSYDRHRTFTSARRTVATLLLPEFIAIAVASPIYIYAIITIQNGTNASELSYVLNDQFGGLGYMARMKIAFARLFYGGYRQHILSAFIFLAGFAAARDRIFRWPLVLIALPFTLLWAANFSYDARNLALAMPFWALCAAASLSQLTGPVKFCFAILVKSLQRLQSSIADLWRRLEARMPRQTFVVPGLLIIAVAGLTVLKGERFTYPFLLAEQYRAERLHLGDRPQCTEKMFSLLQTFHTGPTTLSEWRWACLFHFNNNENCVRIFPPNLFTNRSDLARYAGGNLLVILNRSSLTPTVQTALRSAGVTPAGYAQCDRPAAFFVRHVN